MSGDVQTTDMVHFLVATESVEASERHCDYLSRRVTSEDRVTALNSLRGGDDTDQTDVRDGQKAVDAIADRLDCEVDTKQLVRGNDPSEDILAVADDERVDEIVLGIRKRNPTGKLIFGSTAQEVLLNSERPVVCLPRP